MKEREHGPKNDKYTSTKTQTQKRKHRYLKTSIDKSNIDSYIPQ